MDSHSKWQARSESGDVIAEGDAADIKLNALNGMVERNLATCRLWEWSDQASEFRQTNETIVNAHYRSPRSSS